jgi:hypothetical protein
MSVHQERRSTLISRFRDDAARITATAINEVLQKLGINHRVDGVAVLPFGTLAYLVDIVMRDLTTQGTWGVSFTIPASYQDNQTPDRPGTIKAPEDTGICL